MRDTKELGDHWKQVQDPQAQDKGECVEETKRREPKIEALGDKWETN